MKDYIQKYFHSAITEKKSFFTNIVIDILSSIFSASVLYGILLVLLKITYMLYPSLSINFKMVNKYSILILAFWTCISIIYLLINYVRIIIIINKAMGNKINEKI